MAFYKLFYIVHRRTDYYRLHREVRRMMMPEWYREQEELARKKARQLLAFSLPFIYKTYETLP